MNPSENPMSILKKALPSLILTVYQCLQCCQRDNRLVALVGRPVVARRSTGRPETAHVCKGDPMVP